MRFDPSEVMPHTETLLAVILGAVLATVSGLVASHVETRMRRRERQRDAALFMGELLITLWVILEQAAQFRKTGEPYGPVTTRMLRSARREVDLCERRREQLYDMRDPRLRREVHGLVVRLSLPLDGLLDAIDATRAGNAGPGFDRTRDQAFGFLMEVRANIPPLVERLGTVAGEKIEAYTVPG